MTVPADLRDGKKTLKDFFFPPSLAVELADAPSYTVAAYHYRFSGRLGKGTDATGDRHQGASRRGSIRTRI